MRKALLVAYHFPPAAVSSGHLRTLSLTRYLPRHGWEPHVLTAHPRAYSRRSEDSLSDVPDNLDVVRAFALDARQHLSVRGSYPLFLAQPDRWSTWLLGGVAAGLRMLRRHDIDLVWSTYPIISAHLIAYTLHRLTGLPWVADFRDPVTTADIGTSPMTMRSRTWVERRTLAHARRCVFVTDGARDLYAQQYPEADPRLTVIPNGYDEGDFEALSERSEPPFSAASEGRRIRLTHSGVLYRDGRNPYAFLQAVATLVSENAPFADQIEVVLRASGHDDEYRQLAQQLGLGGVVRIEPPVAYAQALREQADSDALLIFQGAQYNRQIPTKVYEYLRIERPILALVDEAGDTAGFLRAEGIDTIAPIDDPQRIASTLRALLSDIGEGVAQVVPRERVAGYSRAAGAARYAQIFDEAIVS